MPAPDFLQNVVQQKTGEGATWQDLTAAANVAWAVHDGSDREPDYEWALVKGESLRPEGKNSILCALKARAIIDDRQDVLNECFYTGVRCFKSERKRGRELTYLALVEDWIRQEGVQSIALQHHFGTPGHGGVWRAIAAPAGAGEAGGICGRLHAVQHCTIISTLYIHIYICNMCTILSL